MFGAELISYSNTHRSIYCRISRKKVFVAGLFILMLFTLCFTSGVYYGAGYSANQYFQSYQNKFTTQQTTVLNLKQATQKEIQTLSHRLAVLKAELSQLKIYQKSISEHLNINESISINWIQESVTENETDGKDLNEEINAISSVIEQSHTELKAMHDLYLRQIQANQFFPTLKPAETYISSNFGRRIDPLGTGRTYFHEGIDFAAPKGTPIKAAATGVVTWSAPFDNYGNVVELDHGNGYITRYAHNDKNLVTMGEKVEKGDMIATMGASGRATGPHLHFEVLKDGNHINPRKILKLN